MITIETCSSLCFIKLANWPKVNPALVARDWQTISFGRLSS